MSTTFTVFFDGQFWVGVVEIQENGTVRAARHVFGAEPTSPELYEFALRQFGDLLDDAAASMPASTRSRRAPNPKRAARQAANQRAIRPVSTAAQDAIRLSIEAGAQNRKRRNREAREADEDARLDRRRAKARARHRGSA